MKRQPLCWITVCALLLGASALTGCGDPDRRLEGIWVGRSYDNGVPSMDVTRVLVIDGSFVLEEAGARYSGTYKTTRSADPNEILASITRIDRGGISLPIQPPQVMYGLYTFEGPCWNRTGILVVDEGGYPRNVPLDGTFGYVGKRVGEAKSLPTWLGLGDE